MTTEADAIAALAQKQATIVTDGASGNPAGVGARRFLIVPEGYKSREITDPNGLPPAPAYIRQAIAIHSPRSLIDYVDRFGSSTTMLFADHVTSQITAAIDYHDADDLAPDHEVAGHVLHRATLALALSAEFASWAAMDGKMLSQTDFARFIEENREDIATPDAGTLLDIIRDLNGYRNMKWAKVVRTNSGTERFEFKTEQSAKAGDVEIPNEIGILIPIYMGQEHPITLKAFLRWQAKDDAGLMLGIKFARREQARQDAFGDVAMSIATATQRELVYGKIDDDWAGIAKNVSLRRVE